MLGILTSQYISHHTTSQYISHHTTSQYILILYDTTPHHTSPHHITIHHTKLQYISHLTTPHLTTPHHITSHHNSSHHIITLHCSVLGWAGQLIEKILNCYNISSSGLVLHLCWSVIITQLHITTLTKFQAISVDLVTVCLTEWL